MLDTKLHYRYQPWLFGLSRFLPGYHLIKQLADEPERIDLVVMLTAREDSGALT